ncbi:peptide chain release factor N(5)-glutamine methyltransferase [Faunimonas sp. B44]|uniref:peptide chain release factor N(5)-glutamine methyltransferase n=1 Tax=Faunimonas sp. B44 TaxID=3461493 RepID=UPI004044B2AB
MITVREALSRSRAELARAGIETADLDARLLLERALGITAVDLIARPEQEVDPAAGAALASLIERRVRREPVARILGAKEFWGLDLVVSPATLVPRPDTEILVEAVLRWARQQAGPNLTIADLGTGTGAILIALLSELPHARGIATDLSSEALATAAANAQRHGVGDRITFLQADFASHLPERCDAIVSNPPYIRSADLAGLEAEVRDHDPRLALDGGPSGVEAYGKIIDATPHSLRRPGLLALEVGYDQADSVAAMCQARHMSIREIGSDLSGHARAVLAVTAD